MEITSMWGLYTLLLMLIFVVIAVWAWSSKRKKGFEEAANLPFADESEQRSENGQSRENKETKP